MRIHLIVGLFVLLPALALAEEAPKPWQDRFVLPGVEIWLTHEHGDHLAGVAPLQKKVKVKSFAHPVTVRDRSSSCFATTSRSWAT